MDTERRSCGLEFNHTPSPAVCKKPIDKPVRGTTQHRPATLPCHAPSHLSSSASSPPTPRRAKAPDSPRVWRQNSPLPSADRFSGGPPAAPPQTNPIRPLPPGSSPGECRATRHSHAASRRSDAVEPRSDIASHRSFNARCRTETVSTRSATVIDKTAHVSTRSDIATDKIKTSPGRAGQRMYSPLLALRPATPIPIRLPGGQPLGGCLPGLPEQFAGLSPLHSDSGSLRLKAQ